MIKIESRLVQAKDVIGCYLYPKPFHTHLKEYFGRHKEFGSRDRKELRMLCYHFFRMGKAFSALPLEEKLLIGHFLAEDKPDRFVEFFCRNYNIINEEDTILSLEDKISKITKHFPDFLMQSVFPAPGEMSNAVDKDKFYLSLLKQPPVWIKISPPFLKVALNDLNTAGIEYVEYSPFIFKVNAESKLTETESYKKGYFRVQDLASQEIAGYFKPKNGEIWWDCCCGAGGKSLALLDKGANIELYATDIRKQVIKNYEERLQRHNIWNYKALAADVAEGVPVNFPLLDGIIIDAPCTGSGTWARNPENLAYFDAGVIQSFHTKQINILDRAFTALKPGGKLFYITCSVFSKENEGAIEYFCKSHEVKIETQTYIEGYNIEAETMFLCVMKKI